MEWLAAIIAIIALIYFSINYRVFRRVLAVIIAILIATGIVGGIYAYFADIQYKKQRALAESLIKATDLDLSQLRLSQQSYSTTSFDLTGIVTNNSRYTLDSLTLTVEIRNCSESGNDCIIVGSYDVSDWATIPPGQARQFNGSAYFSNLPPLKNWRWSYRVKKISASTHDS